MCQIGNPRGTHPCRRSGCAGRSCRLHAHRTWPRNQWHQCYSTGFWSRKYSLKKSLKGQKCFLLLQWLWCNSVSLIDPKDISSPLSGGQAGNIWPWSGESCSGHSSSPVWMICVQWYLPEVPAHAQLGSSAAKQQFPAGLQQLPVQCSCTGSEHTHLYSSSDTPRAHSTVLFQHGVPGALSELIKHRHSLLCSCTQWP